MKIEREAFLDRLLWLFGPIVWAAHFFLLYGLESFACELSNAPRQEYVRFILLALTIAALIAVTAFVILRSRLMPRTQDTPTGDMQAFLWVTENGLATLALIGILWTAASAVMIPACTTTASDSGRSLFKMRSQSITAEELRSQARQQGIVDIQSARFDGNGEISFVERSSSQKESSGKRRREKAL